MLCFKATVGFSVYMYSNMIRKTANVTKQSWANGRVCTENFRDTKKVLFLDSIALVCHMCAIYTPKTNYPNK